jgi:hypothetical protein
MRAATSIRVFGPAWLPVRLTFNESFLERLDVRSVRLLFEQRIGCALVDSRFVQRNVHTTGCAEPEDAQGYRECQ